MPTLLVTKKMSPELAARVKASVEGRGTAPGAKVAPRTRSMLRMSAFLIIGGCCLLLALSLRDFRRETASQRQALLAEVQRESRDLTPEQLEMPERLHPWLLRLSGLYLGDTVAEELRLPGAFEATLTRPLVYIRGPLADFGSSATVRESAQSSFVDAFVVCLLAPPKTRKEKELRAKARASVIAESEELKRTRHVLRLNDALLGVQFLDGRYEDTVAHAKSPEELAQLRQNWQRLPLSAAKRAVKTPLVLAVMDEPGNKATPAELDGERAHDVRVALVDVSTRKLLLLVRRRVDPSGLSAASRAEFARGVNSCALALDVHEAVKRKDQAALKE